MTYKYREHVKGVEQKTYLTEEQKQRFRDAAGKVGKEPSVLLRDCILKVTEYIESQQTGRIQRPKRATDFIAVNPPGHVTLDGNYRLCRAA